MTRNPAGRKPSHSRNGEENMFLYFFIALIVAWLAFWFALKVATGLIHLLLLAAVVFLVVHFFRRKREV